MCLHAINLKLIYWHKHLRLFFLCPDQEKAHLKADDTGEVGEGQEAA